MTDDTSIVHATRYRARAELCRAKAEWAKTLGVYHTLRDLARQYDALADAAESGRLVPLRRQSGG
jgi:hypothetical protein